MTFRLPLAVAAALAVLVLVVAPARPEGAAPNEQQLADLQKKLAEQQLRLSELSTRLVALRDSTLPDDWVKSLAWRSIGPGSMGGRITAISVYEADPTTYWIATASGGLLKTTNNGVTFAHQFDKQATVSIGDVAVAPSNRDVVYVGTGEANPRNSVSYGDGVYKSTDGGTTWTNVGLANTFQIGKIVVHPKNPDVVYVGALGRLYGPNPERGLYKTSDGGKTWAKVLFVDDATGVIDAILHPTDPDTLIVATWERKRDEFDSHPGNEMLPVEGYDRYDPIAKWGAGGGLYKTTDGGKSWKKLNAGLPTCHLGRIGLDWYRKDPKVVFAIVDSAKIATGTPPGRIWLGIQGDSVEGGVKLTSITDGGPAQKAGLKVGDLIKTADKNAVGDYSSFLQSYQTRKAGDKLVLGIVRDGKPMEVTVTVENRPGPTGQEGLVAAMTLFGAMGDPTPEGGMRLTRLVPNSPATAAGLQDGDILTTIDKKPTPTREKFAEIMGGYKAGDKLTVTVLRGKETKTIEVVLRDSPRGFGPGGGTSTRPYNYMYGGQQPNVQDQQGPNSFECGGVYKSTDGGETWSRINSLNPRPMYFSVIRVDPSDDKFVYVCGVSLHRSKDGGKTFTDDGNRGVHPDQHALWVNPKDGRHMIVGCDGGFYATYDRMQNWDHLNHCAIGQFYHVAIDGRKPFRVYGGLQDNGTWGGPSRGLSGPTLNEDWINVSGGDGFVVRIDPTDPDLVYFEIQDGGMQRRNLRTGEQAFIRPRQAQGAMPYRFNWNTPFFLADRNPRIYYCAGNHVFRSMDRGNDLKTISPEITRTKRGSATALAESPRNPDVLWVGSDDGFLWVSKDGGAKWENVTENVRKAGLPGYRWVSTIEPSRYADGRCYVTFDAHRSNDDNPYVFVTEDNGATWKPLTANLPWGSTRCCREDIENEHVLYVGTEFAAFASLNRGLTWAKINNNLPTVAIHEFAQHPTTGEMVAATHGRSLWVLDVKPVRQMSSASLKSAATLYEPAPGVRWRSEPTRISQYGMGHRRFFGENPPSGASIWYSLAKPASKATLKVTDVAGRTVRDLQVKREAGLHRVVWDLRGMPQARPGGRPGGGGFRQGGPMMPAGTYKLVLSVDGQEFVQAVRVENDPTESAGQLFADPPEPETKEQERIDD